MSHNGNKDVETAPAVDENVDPITPSVPLENEPVEDPTKPDPPNPTQKKPAREEQDDISVKPFKENLK
jgi:hypothetical protein